MDLPEKIGRYEIERMLGYGGMAVVFLGRDPLMARRVAIKLLPRQLTFSDNLRERFYREARIIAGLEHPAIVRIYDFGEHEGQPFLVMHHMAGGSLRDRLSPVLSLDETARIFAHISPALDKAHARGIIHRDLKPDNVLFDEDDLPYLADFGIARLAEATQTMTIAGTPPYMSPEQFKGERALDARTDIYALGAMLFQMLTGAPPFQADTPARLMHMHIYEPVPDIRQRQPTVPAQTQAIVERAMAKEPAERYATADELATAVRALCSAESTQTAATATLLEVVTPESPAAQIEPDAPAARRKIPVWGWGVGGLLLLIACLIAGWGLSVVLGGGDDGETLVTLATQTPTPALAATSEDELAGDVGPASTGVAQAMTSPTAASTVSPTRSQSLTVTETLAMTSSPEAGDLSVRRADEMTMLFVPAGSFQMGSTEDDPEAYDDEFPEHEVALDAFWIDLAEVSNAQYELCVASGDCRASSLADDADYNGADYPVVGVSWNDAADYCAWTGGRLPTEAEWEYAARGPESNRYPWGDAAPTCNVAQIYGCDGGVGPAGGLPAGASWVGALDMAGNAWEWVQDWYESDYYENSPPENPTGPSSGSYKVLRGGGWGPNSHLLRAAHRNPYDPDDRYNSFGFRCVALQAEE